MKEEIRPDNHVNNQINQGQFFEIITSNDFGWQALIYDLVKTEQLDPWDIDIGLLAEKYLEIVREIEDADFFVSSKVLLACSLLLRLKSEILLGDSSVSINELLYGKQSSSYVLERIEIDEDEIPLLVPRTPIPRHKKVTLEELMSALNKAIDTENRRIKKEIKQKRAEKSALVVLPKLNKIPLKQRVKHIYARIKGHFDVKKVHMKFSELAPSRDEKLSAFLPVLHLTNQEKLWLRQEQHFDEIHMTLERIEEDIEELKEDVEEIRDDMGSNK